MKRGLSCVAICLTLMGANATSALAQPAEPETAARALQRAATAYEYGDLAALIDASRPVAEGAFADATPADRAEALRFLGVGLFLSGRPDGAETAFVQLLALRPQARLDRRTTRPDVVSFFESVRRKQTPMPSLAWAFLPPFGQIKNGDSGRAWLIGAAEVLSIGGAVATYVWWKNNQGDDHSFGQSPAGPGKSDTAEKVRAANIVACVMGVGVYAAGVADALLRRERAVHTEEPQVSVSILPMGAALRVRF